MAWPFTRLRTYVPGGPPSIKAADLNAIQDAINALYTFPPFFGDGSSGAYAQAAGAVSATTTGYYTTFDLSGTAAFRPDGHVIFAQQYIRMRGTSEIFARGQAGPDDSSAAGLGFGSANQTLGTGATGGIGGPVGFAGFPGGSRLNTSLGGSGGAGGDESGAGGAVGGVGGTASLNAQLEARTLHALVTGYLLGFDGATYGTFPIQGGGGGGGGGYIGAPFNNPGLGGGGGGGPIILVAPIIDIGAGTIVDARGGNGGSRVGGAPGDFGGGGGGGGGGPIILVCSELIEDGLVTAAGGAGGTTDGGVAPQGIAGSAGTIIRRILFP